jgi:glycosyltransferase involved in cell wall biosynthesis
VIRRRLRVAVPEAVRSLRPRTGHGRVWWSVLEQLERMARVRYGGGRADVWLADGHDAPPPGELPVVAFMSEAPWRMPEAMTGVAPDFAALLERRSREAAARAARIVCPSQASAGQIADVFAFPRERVDVVAHGVDAARFAGATPARRARPYVLFVSQIHPRKNLGALREAVALVGGIDLVVVGAPAQDRADSSGLLAGALAPIDGASVEAAEAPDDAALASLMAGCAAFCLPSLWEGFGLTALEAMAAGAPVVVSDRGALPEVVAGAGIVVAPEPEAIADGLRRALADPEPLRRAGRERAATLSWERSARGWLASLERAAG